MRWAVPLMRGGDRAAAKDHERCRVQPCRLCNAEAHLEASDWFVVAFYRRVSDQVENLTPMGVKDGPPWLALKLTELEAALRIYDVPAEYHAELVDDVRWLHDALQDRVKVPGVHRLDIDELEPPEWSIESRD